MSRSWDRFDALTVAALAACWVVVGALPFRTSRFGDGNFHREAKILALAVQGAGSWSSLTASRGPAPVAYYAVPYLLAPPGSDDSRYWRLGAAWNLAWMAVSLLLIRRTAAEVGGATAGKAAVGLALATPFWIYYAYGITAEAPAFVGAAAAAYGWTRRSAWLTGAGLTLFVLSRPNGVLVAAIALAASCWRREHARTLALAGGGALAAALVAALVVRLLPGKPVAPGQADNLAWVALQGSFQYRDEPWDWRYWDDKTRQGSRDYQAWVQELNHLERRAKQEGTTAARLEWQWVAGDLWEHPWLRLRMAAVRLLALHVTLVSSVGPAAFGGRGVYTAFHVAVNAMNAVLAVGSLLFLAARRGTWWDYWALWGPWVALVTVHFLLYAEPRYLLPARPGLLVMAAAGFGPWTKTRF